MTSAIWSVTERSGDSMALLGGASRSAEVLLVRPKPIRPNTSESDASRTIDSSIQHPNNITTGASCTTSATAATTTTTATTTRNRPLGAFTLVMPVASSSSVYERELCSLFNRTALGVGVGAGAVAEPVVALADHRPVVGVVSRVRRSRTPNQQHAAAAAAAANFNLNLNTLTRRPCSACYAEPQHHHHQQQQQQQQPIAIGACQNNNESPAPRCPLSDLLPAAATAASRSTRTYSVHSCAHSLSVSSRHHSEPHVMVQSLSTCIDHSLGTRKRRRKETDENASEARNGDLSHHTDWPDSPLPESGDGDDDAIDADLSASPTRADSKCRRRYVASTSRPSINAEKMLTASPSSDAGAARQNDADSQSQKRGSVSSSPNSARCMVPLYERLVAMHGSYSMTDTLLNGYFTQATAMRPASGEPVETSASLSATASASAAAAAASQSLGNKAQTRPDSIVDEAQSEECDASTSSLGKSNELPTFASHGATPFRIISELDIDQIENN